ncbi:MAG: ABC transporter permease [Anaerolineae bacterium]
MLITIVLRRVVALPITLLGVATAVFVVMRILPGDPVESILVEAGASPALVMEWRQRYGLAEPLPVQYWYFLRAIGRGDLGRSISTGRPVFEMIFEQMPSTVVLALSSLAFAAGLGGGIGLLAARHQGTWVDGITRLLAVGTVSLPAYWTGIMAIMLFSAGLHWLPASGQGSWQHLVLPTLTLGTASMGAVARLVRASVLEVAAQPYVQLARAKGLPGRILVGRHILPAAATPILTFLGVQAGFLLAGTAITETVFSRRGVGQLLVSAVVSKDYPLAQGCILLAACTYILANTISDLLAAAIDPRVRAG